MTCNCQFDLNKGLTDEFIPLRDTHYIFRISKLSFLHPAKLHDFLIGQKYLPAFDLQVKILPDEKIDNFSGDKVFYKNVAIQRKGIFSSNKI